MSDSDSLVATRLELINEIETLEAAKSFRVSRAGAAAGGAAAGAAVGAGARAGTRLGFDSSDDDEDTGGRLGFESLAAYRRESERNQMTSSGLLARVKAHMLPPHLPPDMVGPSDSMMGGEDGDGSSLFEAHLRSISQNEPMTMSEVESRARFSPATNVPVVKVHSASSRLMFGDEDKDGHASNGSEASDEASEIARLVEDALQADVEVDGHGDGHDDESDGDDGSVTSDWEDRSLGANHPDAPSSLRKAASRNTASHLLSMAQATGAAVRTAPPTLVDAGLTNESVRSAVEESFGPEALAVLSSLSLAGNAMTTMPEPLPVLGAVRTLDISRNPLVALGTGWDSVLPTLQSLNLAGTGVASLEPLSQCPLLTALDASSNSLTSAAVLAQLPRLRTCNLADNALARLEPGATLGTLVELDVSGNALTSLEALFRAAPALRVLCASGNHVASLTGLEAAPSLAHLDVSANHLTSLASGGSLSLAVLNAADNRIGSLEELRQLPALAQLVVARNALKGAPLAFMDSTLVGTFERSEPLVKLVALALDGNSVASLQGIASGAPHLAHLSAADNALASLDEILDEISKLAQLARIDLRYNPATEAFYTRPDGESTTGVPFESLEAYDKAAGVSMGDAAYMGRLYYRSYVIHTHHSLAVLDGIAITPVEMRLAVSLEDKFSVLFSVRKAGQEATARTLDVVRAEEREAELGALASDSEPAERTGAEQAPRPVFEADPAYTAPARVLTSPPSPPLSPAGTNVGMCVRAELGRPRAVAEFGESRAERDYRAQYEAHLMKLQTQLDKLDEHPGGGSEGLPSQVSMFRTKMEFLRQQRETNERMATESMASAEAGNKMVAAAARGELARGGGHDDGGSDGESESDPDASVSIREYVAVPGKAPAARERSFVSVLERSSLLPEPVVGSPSPPRMRGVEPPASLPVGEPRIGLEPYLHSAMSAKRAQLHELYKEMLSREREFVAEVSEPSLSRRMMYDMVYHGMSPSSAEAAYSRDRSFRALESIKSLHAAFDPPVDPSVENASRMRAHAVSPAQRLPASARLAHLASLKSPSLTLAALEFIRGEPCGASQETSAMELPMIPLDRPSRDESMTDDVSRRDASSDLTLRILEQLGRVSRARQAADGKTSQSSDGGGDNGDVGDDGDAANDGVDMETSLRDQVQAQVTATMQELEAAHAEAEAAEAAVDEAVERGISFWVPIERPEGESATRAEDAGSLGIEREESVAAEADVTAKFFESFPDPDAEVLAARAPSARLQRRHAAVRAKAAATREERERRAAARRAEAMRAKARAKQERRERHARAEARRRAAEAEALARRQRHRPASSSKRVRVRVRRRDGSRELSASVSKAAGVVEVESYYEDDDGGDEGCGESYEYVEAPRGRSPDSLASGESGGEWTSLAGDVAAAAAAASETKRDASGSSDWRATLLVAARVPAASGSVSSSSSAGSTILTDLRMDSAEARAMQGVLASESLREVSNTRGASYSLVRVMKIFNAERLEWFSSLDGFANVDGVNPSTLTTLCSAGFGAYGDSSELVFCDSLSLATELYPKALPTSGDGRVRFRWRALVCVVKPGTKHVFPTESLASLRSDGGRAQVEQLLAAGYSSFSLAREMLERSREVVLIPYPNRALPAYLIEYEVTM
ncbi:yop effector YopM [Thecamonas trahens ATCC 50062]|uniref:Yop effector YopM n=1 Tax=Thecamonas trahens ATCC 50062 TaxID=461836 RepID=A0A0L0D2U1_THETB|nr:yop effector YopM [Thecamonas trahens ATCC 50062]KNC46516.1 yop effector YopM [Thecamonas trahens ATCC 50062]|eukprot:XP_013760297.1 yop effector YopM [Thecamonas trahens ATCC 50062]